MSPAGVSTFVPKGAHPAIGITDYQVHPAVLIEIGQRRPRTGTLQVGEVEAGLLVGGRLANADQPLRSERQFVASGVEEGRGIGTSVLMKPDVAAVGAVDAIVIAVAVEIVPG